MKFVGIALLLCSITALGQTAKVIALSPEDAKEAKSLYAQQAEIEKRIDMFRLQISDTYLRNYEKKNPYVFSPKPGWDAGFLFSEDFKYIVPRPAPIVAIGDGGLTWSTSEALR